MFCLNHAVLVRIVGEEGVLHEINQLRRLMHYINPRGANLIEHNEVGWENIGHPWGDHAHVEVTSLSLKTYDPREDASYLSLICNLVLRSSARAETRSGKAEIRRMPILQTNFQISRYSMSQS